MDVISFRVNGEEASVEAPAQMPLLWVLRDVLALTGAKFGCGIAACGACTVHLDGAPIRSCVTPVSAVAGREITTIEGASGEVAEALRRAWLDAEVSQCGYCQPGQLMSALGLLARNPQPSDADIDVAMRGNICRCGSYQAIRTAIHRAAEEVSESDPEGVA